MRPQFSGFGRSWGLRYGVVSDAFGVGSAKVTQASYFSPIDAASPVGCVIERYRQG